MTVIAALTPQDPEDTRIALTPETVGRLSALLSPQAMAALEPSSSAAPIRAGFARRPVRRARLSIER